MAKLPVHAYIHLVKALLHASQRVPRLRHQFPSIPHQHTQHAHRFVGAERACQQPAVVQTSDPFTIHPVGLLSPRHSRQLAGIHDHHLQSGLLRNLVRRYPVHSRAFHFATDSTFLCLSHSAIFSSSGVVAPKCSMSRPVSSFGAYTRCCVLPRSIPPRWVEPLASLPLRPRCRAAWVSRH
jgi:hypothetical protein